MVVMYRQGRWGKVLEREAEGLPAGWRRLLDESEIKHLSACR